MKKTVLEKIAKFWPIYVFWPYKAQSSKIYVETTQNFWSGHFRPFRPIYIAFETEKQHFFDSYEGIAMADLWPEMAGIDGSACVFSGK